MNRPEASFRARGVVYQGARDFYDERIEGGAAAVGSELSDELAPFFEQPFFARTTYDALPLATISRAAARLAGVTDVELVRENAAWVADRDIRGIYRLLLGALSPDLVATRLASAAMRYFDFGAAESKMAGPGICRAAQAGIPEPLAWWFTACVDGFVHVALTRAGAKNLAIRAEPPRSEGMKDGVEVVTLRFEYTWMY